MTLLFVLCSPGLGLAEKGVITPSITAKTTCNDNIQFKKKTDFEWLVTPSVDVDYGQENWTLSTGARANIYRYSQLTDYDRENYNFWLEGEKSLSETFQVNCRSTFDYDHTVASEMTESGTIVDQALRRKYSIAPGFSWSMTEKDNLSVSLPYSATRYTGSDNADMSTRGGNMNWSHVLNDERTSLLGQFSYTNYNFKRSDGNTDQGVYSMLGGMSYNPTELLDLSASVGFGHARTDVTYDLRPGIKSTATYLSFNMSGTYHREKWEFSLGADRESSPLTDGELSIRTRLWGSGRYAFTERLSFSLNGAYFLSKSGGEISDSENRTYNIQPRIVYSLSDHSSIGLEFQHVNNKNIKSGEEQMQNQTALRFDYHYPWFF